MVPYYQVKAMSPNYTNDHCCQVAHTLKGIANKQSMNKAAIKQDIYVTTLPLKLGVHHRRGDKKVLRARHWAEMEQNSVFWT